MAIKKDKESTRSKNNQCVRERDVRVLLDNIRSTHNVGSIFRTAETLGISKIYCVGTTPAPIDRFGRTRADIAKVSLGAEKTIPWVHSDDGVKIVKELDAQGFQIISIEQDERSIDYKSAPVSDKVLIILGNEVDGVSRELMKRSHLIVEIPLKGHKESLNVSVAAGVVMYGLLDRKGI